MGVLGLQFDPLYHQYVLLVDKNAHSRRLDPEYEEQTFYGQLDFILICSLPASRALGLAEATTYILGLVQTCKTQPEGGDASKQVVSYTKSHPPTFINLNAIRGVVGRVQVGGKRWGIVDRSGDFARTTFALDEEPQAE